MTDYGFSGIRSLALLIGVALVGSSFIVGTAVADGARAAGSPSWGFLVVPIGLLVVGSFLIATGVATGVVRQPKLTGWILFLLVTGAGLTILALIVSSAFFYACAPSECSTDTPVPAENLSIAGNLALVGLGVLAAGTISFGASRLVPSKTAAAANTEPWKSLKQ